MASSSWSIHRFLHRLASTEPVPGGGSAAALTGALGVALGAMVSRILLARSQISPETRRRLARNIRLLDGLLRRLEGLIEEDSVAYQAWVTAQRTGRNLPQARHRAIQAPLAIGNLTKEALRAMENLKGLTGPLLGSDRRAGEALLRGAFQAARLTAQVNRR